MTKEDYLKTFYVNSVKVDLGLDDYGQCYYIEWEENGELREMGLGTYNEKYMETIYSLLDERYRELIHKMFEDTLSEEEDKELTKYEVMFEKEYNE